MFQLLQQIFQSVGVNYTSTQLKKEISDTAFIWSMFGLSNLISKFNLDHERVQFEEKSELSGDDCPMIVVYDGDFGFIDSESNGKVSIYSEAQGKRMINKEDFIKKWNGAALLLHPDEHAIEPDYKEHLNIERKNRFKRLALIGCLTVCIALGIIMNPLLEMWVWGALLAVNCAGIGVAFMLLQKQLHIPNRFADKLCGLAKESHCEDVTESEGAELFGLVKLSEIGAGFFGVNLVALLFWPQSLFFLALVAACVLPFTFWSLWYQKFKAKSWCVLCLCTLALMWLQAGIYALGGVYGMVSHQWTIPLGLVAAYGGAVIMVNRLMAMLEQRSEDRQWHLQYNNLKAHDEVVEAFEGKAPRFATGRADCSSIVFGNPDAERQITVFSNPYCGPCAMMHRRIKDMPGRGVGITYVMTYFTKEASRINRLIIAAYQQLGPERTWQLMTEWYDGGKARGEEFFNGLNLDPEAESVVAEFEKHNHWREDDRLIGTPTVIVNGRELVGPYSVDDYMYIPA